MGTPSTAEETAFKCGSVALVGRANVGKSTLLNALVGHKLAAVSPRSQTTRTTLLGVRTTPTSQMGFVDTPGLHDPRHALGRLMVRAARDAIDAAEVVVWVVDVSHRPMPDDLNLAQQLANAGKPVVIAMNKSDLLRPEQVIEHTEAYLAALPEAAWMLTSATRRDNLTELCALIEAALPVGPGRFPAEMLTDQSDQALAGEMIRESALYLLRQEVPHGVAVLVSEWSERANGTLYVAAEIVLERDAHKPIVIGKDGRMLRRIGRAARRRLERQFGRSIYLDLHVAVRPSWRENQTQLRRLGLVGGGKA